MILPNKHSAKIPSECDITNLNKRDTRENKRIKSKDLIRRSGGIHELLVPPLHGDVPHVASDMLGL